MLLSPRNTYASFKRSMGPVSKPIDIAANHSPFSRPQLEINSGQAFPALSFSKTGIERPWIVRVTNLSDQVNEDDVLTQVPGSMLAIWRDISCQLISSYARNHIRGHCLCKRVACEISSKAIERDG
ncbi:hypothetical protein BT69DRAFT_207043 [Atractiella rhizophila]|nr:hypothetical protein BT69DRAFT_207043 [Atractiella rhizophila]